MHSLSLFEPREGTCTLCHNLVYSLPRRKAIRGPREKGVCFFFPQSKNLNITGEGNTCSPSPKSSSTLLSTTLFEFCDPPAALAFPGLGSSGRRSLWGEMSRLHAVTGRLAVHPVLTAHRAISALEPHPDWAPRAPRPRVGSSGEKPTASAHCAFFFWQPNSIKKIRPC